jgi:hypothetical protein
MPILFGLVVNKGLKTFLRSAVADPDFCEGAGLARRDGHLAHLCLRLEDRIDRIDNQVENDLLKLDRIAPDAHRACSGCELQGDLVPLGHGGQKSDSPTVSFKSISAISNGVFFSTLRSLRITSLAR